MTAATIPSTLEEIRADPEVRAQALWATREMALRDFRFFVVDVMGFDGKTRPNEPDFSHGCYDEVFRCFQDIWTVKNGVFLMSRKTGKTTLIALWAMWMALRDPDTSILIDCSREEMGISILDRLIRPWMLGLGGGHLREVFGPFGDLPPRGAKNWGSKTSLMFPRRTTTRRDPTIFVIGSEQSATGAHPDILIGEDLVDEHSSRTVGERDRIKTHWAAMQYLQPKVSLLCGTVWADDDLHIEKWRHFVKMIEAGEEPTFHAIRLRARVERKVRAWVLREDGKRVEIEVEEYDDDCPARFPHLDDATLKAMKVDESAQWGGTFLYAGQMDLNPIPWAKRMFRHEWIEKSYYEDREVFEVGENGLRNFREDGRWAVKPQFTVCVFSDLAGSQEQHADRSAHLVLAVNHQRQVYVLHAEAGLFDPTTNLNIMSRLFREYDALYVGIEGGVLRSIYEPLTRDWNLRFPTKRFTLRKVESGGARGSTNDRALRIQPLAERGDLHLQRSMTGLIEELLRYSGKDDTKDDYVAALAIGVRNIVPGQQPDSEEKKKTIGEMMDDHAFERAQAIYAGVTPDGEWGGDDGGW